MSNVPPGPPEPPHDPNRDPSAPPPGAGGWGTLPTPPGAGWGPPGAGPPGGGYQPPPGYGAPPGYGYGGPAAPQPPTYLVQAILTTLFCCLPFGIVAIVYASQVSSKWSAGDWQGAQAASARARTWAIVSLVAGLATILIWIVVATMAGDTDSSSDF